VKALFSKLLGEQRWTQLSWHRDHFGVADALACNAGLFFGSPYSRIPAKAVGLQQDFYLRPGTADLFTFEAIFGPTREYDVDFDQPNFIIDAGAHIGMAAMLFASRYPLATVVAVEPEPSNYALLVKNTRDYPNIKTLRGGLWSRRVNLAITNEDAATWSFRVVETSDADGIPAFGVPDIMTRFNLPRVDILKIDIEGSEIEALSSSTQWMP
jgi:FkbM family methyltransferase